MNNFTKICAAVLVVAGVASASAAGQKAAGAYYNVPIDILKDQKPTTSGTAQLLVYSRDNGTTAVQLLVEAEEDTVGFILHRQSSPDEASDVFGSIDDLFINYRVMNRPTGTDNQAFDLLNENGRPLGDTFKLLDASDEPLTNIQLTYTMSGPTITTPTTGVARVLPGGCVSIPKSPVTQQSRFSGISYRLIATDPGTGTTLGDINALTSNHRGDMFSLSDIPAGGDVTTLTIPFLNDWNSTASISVYSGQILDTAGTPAAHAPFTIMDNMNTSRRRGLGHGGMPPTFATGPDGRFRLAFKQPPLQISVPSINNVSHSIPPSQETVIRP